MTFGYLTFLSVCGVEHARNYNDWQFWHLAGVNLVLTMELKIFNRRYQTCQKLCFSFSQTKYQVTLVHIIFLVTGKNNLKIISHQSLKAGSLGSL